MVNLKSIWKNDECVKENNFSRSTKCSKILGESYSASIGILYYASWENMESAFELLVLLNLLQKSCKIRFN